MSKIDPRGGLAKLMTQASQSTDDRFKRASEIMSANPQGLAVQSQPQTTVLPAALPHVVPHTADEAEGSATGTVTVDIDLVGDNPYNARQIYDAEIVRERAESIAVNGQMTPAPACVDPDNPGRYILIGGHYRKRGLLRANKSKIELKLLDVKGKLDLYRLSYMENDQREDGTALDDAMSWRKLLEDSIAKTHDDIATVTGKSRPVIVKTLALLDLPASVMDILIDKPARFNLTAGYELVRIAKISEQAAVETAKRVVSDEGMSTRELTNLLERLNQPERKRKETSRQHKIIRNGCEVGAIKDWDSGRVMLDVKVDDPQERAQLVTMLRERFGLTQ